MGLEKRIGALEEQFARTAPDEEGLLRDRDRPEVIIAYDRAVERFRAALEEARATNQGSSRVRDTPELGAAKDEMLRARNALRAYANSRDWEIGGDFQDGDS